MFFDFFQGETSFMITFSECTAIAPLDDRHSRIGYTLKDIIRVKWVP